MKYAFYFFIESFQKFIFIIIYILIYLSILSTIQLRSESSILTEKQKINFLMNELEKSQLKFIRNGEEYSAREAREHMQKKLDYAGERIRTADEFIRYIASKSSFSGKPYYVVLPDGRKMESEKWLSEKLSKIGEK